MNAKVAPRKLRLPGVEGRSIRRGVAFDSTSAFHVLPSMCCLPCVALGYCVGNAFENFVIHLRRISVFLCSTSVSRLAGQLRLLHSPRELGCLDSDAFGVSRRNVQVEKFTLTGLEW